MESSILISTKNVLNVSESDTAFDEAILMHINASFSILTQLGVGTVDGFTVEDDAATWEEFEYTIDHPNQRVIVNLVRTYVFLKVRMLFDPPETSFLISAMTDQIQEYEWRLSALREAS